MKYFTSIWILLLLLNSCSVKKITQQYLDNDDVCFCGLDSTLLEGEKKYDISTLDFDKVKERSASDTLINNNNTLQTWRGDMYTGFTISNFDKSTQLKTDYDYNSNGFLELKMTCLKFYEEGYFSVGHAVQVGKNGKLLEEVTSNYVLPHIGLDTVNIIAKKYPICWKEVINIVEAKIGKYELLRLYRHADKEPNYKGMQYYWTVKTKKKWEKPKYYFVDAVTGRVERAIIIVTLGTDDML